MTSGHECRKLVFHIGHHKTGSTTIQDAFATDRVRLASGRILYPGRMAHNYLSRHVETYASSGKILTGSAAFPSLATLSEQFQRKDFDVAVISGEEFEGAEPSAVRKAVQRFLLPHVDDHSVICYVRPHAARVLSSFAENVKLGRFSGSPEDFFKKVARTGRFLYSRRLPEWDRVFKGHFFLRPVIREELQGGSVLQDFVAIAFGPERPATILPVESANEALCLEDLLLVRLVQDCLSKRDHKLRHAMGWQLAPAFAAAVPTTGKRTKLALHKALAERIRATYRADAREVDSQFFDGRPLLQGELDRAVDEAVPQAQSFDPADHLSADTMRAVTVLGAQINELLDHESGSWPAFLLERRIARLHGERPQTVNVPAGRKLSGAWRSAVDVAGDMDGGEDQTGDDGGKLDLSLLERLAGTLGDAGKPDVLSRRLGNVLTQTARGDVQITTADLMRWMDGKGFPVEVQVVLHEFLLNLFFYDFAPSIVGALRERTVDDLAAGPDELGLSLQRLLAGEDHVADMARAGVHYLRGALPEAYGAFDKARHRLMAGGTLYHHNRGLLSLRSLPVLTDWARQGNLADLPALEMESDRRFGDDLPVVLVGMDGGYYARYAARLVETAQGRANLHFHVANPEGVELQTAPHLRHSFETVPHATTAYYATMRFLRLPGLLRHYDRPIATMDADARFIGPVNQLFQGLSGQDVLLNAALGLKNPRRYLAAVPWRHVTAQIMVAAPSDGAAEFLDIFGRLFAGLTRDSAASVWWVDQAVLAQTRDLCRHEGRAPRIGIRWLHPVSGMKQGKL